MNDSRLPSPLSLVDELFRIERCTALRVIIDFNICVTGVNYELAKLRTICWKIKLPRFPPVSGGKFETAVSHLGILALSAKLWLISLCFHRDKLFSLNLSFVSVCNNTLQSSYASFVRNSVPSYNSVNRFLENLVLCKTVLYKTQRQKEGCVPKI